MESLNFYIITHFITAAVSLFIAYIVFTRNKKSITHITLSMFSIAVFFWAFSYSIWLLAGSEEAALFWSRTLNLGATFIPLFLLHWILCLLRLDRKKKFLITLTYLATFGFALFSYSEYYINKVVPIGIFPYWPKGEWLYLVFMLVVWIPVFFYAFYLLLRELRQRKSSARQQIIYVLLGLVIGFLGGSTNYLIVFGVWELPPVASSLVVFFPILFSYSMVRYRFMDVKLVVRKSSVYIVSLAIIFGLTSLAKVSAEKYLKEFVFWTDLLVLFLAVLTFPYIQSYFSKVANKYFFTSLYDSRSLILKTGNELKTFLEISELYSFLYLVFSENLHTKAFGVLTYIEESGEYQLQYNKGFGVEKGEMFQKNNEVEKLFISKNKIVIVDELKNLHYNEETKGLINLLEGLSVELLIPLKAKGNLIGLLAFGSKETNEAYSDEDLDTLEIIAGQAAVAIENAQLYSKVKGFNVELRREIKKATEDLEISNKSLSRLNGKLKKANEKLKLLDSAKNEFISIASHQLRTPLATIKGYISTLMEGDYGKTTKEMDRVLKNTFNSNERLIRLVEDLLKISRIESGNFVLDLGEGDIIDLVDKVVIGLQPEAKKNGLKLNFVKPKKPIKPFILDNSKVTEVISNLVDNALKYTPKGKVEVILEESKEKVKVIVSDTGKGMKKDELKYVFEKFRRGNESVSHNTEGTGLGLYVCRKIVKAHGGKVYAESDGPGKGSRFIVELDKKFKAKNALKSKK